MAVMIVNDNDCHLSGVCTDVCVYMCVPKGIFERLTQSSHHPVTARGLWVIGSVFPETMSSFFTSQWASYFQPGLNFFSLQIFYSQLVFQLCGSEMLLRKEEKEI